MEPPSRSQRPVRRRPLVVTFCDASYSRIFENWLHYVRRIGEIELLVGAFDAETFEFVSAMGIPCQPVELAGNRFDHFMRGRTAMLRDLVVSGRDVLHSDLDAVWLGDPLDVIERVPADMVFSQGTIWPPPAHEVNGVVLCAGFYVVRSNPRTIEFMDSWVSRIGERSGDQWMLNELMIEGGLTWNRRHDYELEYREKTFRCFDHVQTASLPNGMTVSLLPHADFQRLVQPGRAPTVKHPLSPKTGPSTEDVLIAHDCWALDGGERHDGQ